MATANVLRKNDQENNGILISLKYCNKSEERSKIYLQWRLGDAEENYRKGIQKIEGQPLRDFEAYIALRISK